MKKIYVVGAGTMGTDIARVFASNGMDVMVRDISEEIIAGSQARVQKSLDKQVSKGKLDEGKASEILGNMKFTTDLQAAADCDLIIEAAVENLEIKETLFRELDAVCGPDVIFATNTSALSITQLAAMTGRADKFVGMHFFNPATVMKLVEIIRGESTSDETFKAVYDLACDLGKDPVEVSETAGFVVNRLLIPLINDAVFLYSEGAATAEDIDKAMRLGANHPMGPFTLGDFIGLDVCLAIMETLHRETGDQKYRPAPLLRKMVRSGKLGRKTGEGFFKY